MERQKGEPKAEAGAHKAMELGLGRRRRDWGGRMGLDSRKSDKCSSKSVVRSRGGGAVIIYCTECN